MSSKDIRRIILEKLNIVGEQIDDNFEFDYVDKPNTLGILQVRNRWFVYASDEKNVKTFTGPFGDEDIVYACAKMLHKSKHFEEYRFSDEAKWTYVHGHYRSIKEAEEKSNCLSKERILRIYGENDFVKNTISSKEYVAVSKAPIEIDGVRFRLSLFFNNERLTKATLVAVTKQYKEEYTDKSTRAIHEAWLCSCQDHPTKNELYGNRYELDSMTISCEQDPKSGSDVIVIDYAI